MVSAMDMRELDQLTGIVEQDGRCEPIEHGTGNFDDWCLVVTDPDDEDTVHELWSIENWYALRKALNERV